MINFHVKKFDIWGNSNCNLSAYDGKVEKLSWDTVICLKFKISSEHVTHFIDLSITQMI